MAALDDLQDIAAALQARYPRIPLYFDLGELRGYHYHTGISFAVFVPEMGQSIAQGGRYDDIGRDFGRARPATGFSTDLRLLVERGHIAAPSRAAVWAPFSTEPGLHAAVDALRRDGRRVIAALPGQQDMDAASHGCSRILRLVDGTWQVCELNF